MWSSLPSSSPDAHSSPVLVLSNHLFVEIHFLLARKSENILWTDWDFWVMTECPSDYLWDLCSYSGDHLWSLDISPRLILTPSSHPGMNDEALVMTMTDLDFSFPSPVCCLVFVKSHLVTCHIQTNINSVMKHKYSWVMSDHWGSNATGMLRLFLLYLLARRGCALFPTVCKTAGAPDRLRVIYFLIRAIIQLYCPGQSLGNIASNIFISESDRGQFSSSPVINVTPHPYFSFQGRRLFYMAMLFYRIPI